MLGLPPKGIVIHEIMLFLAVFTLFVVIGLFYYHNSLQLRVQKESNCLKESKLTQGGGVYNVVGKLLNRPAFEVVYDTMDKTSKIQCACAEGTAESIFTNIPYYDLRSSTPDKERVKYKETLTCNCETAIGSASSDKNMSYYGEPGITRFMYDQKNTGFFDMLLYGPNYEYLSR